MCSAAEKYTNTVKNLVHLESIVSNRHPIHAIWTSSTAVVHRAMQAWQTQPRGSMNVADAAHHESVELFEGEHPCPVHLHPRQLVLPVTAASKPVRRLHRVLVIRTVRLLQSVLVGVKGHAAVAGLSV